jgi:tetratricopeptide (TPR) repeat protein
MKQKGRADLMNRISRRGVAAAAMVGLALAGAVFAVEQGRMTGTVVDETGAPVAGVHVIVTSPDISSYKMEKTTDARGQFNLIVLDAALNYRIRLEKQGYPTLEQPLKLKIQETIKETYTLKRGAPAGAAAGASGARAATPEEAAALEKLKGKNEAINAYNQGVTALNAKDIAGAIAGFERAATLDPSLAEAQGALSELYLEQGKKSEALAAADRFLALQPGKPRGLIARYEALKAMGDRTRAAEALETLAAAFPTRETAVRFFNEGAEAARENKMDAAVTYLKRSLEIDKTLEPAYRALAGIYLSRKNNAEAMALIDRWIEVRPDNPDALTYRYQALLSMKDPRAKEAKAAMEHAKASNSKPGDAYNQGIVFYNANNIAEATKAFESVVQADPNHPRAHYMLGLCYANSGDLSKAKEHLQTFIRLAPKDKDAATAEEMLKYLN